MEGGRGRKEGASEKVATKGRQVDSAVIKQLFRLNGAKCNVAERAHSDEVKPQSNWPKNPR